MSILDMVPFRPRRRPPPPARLDRDRDPVGTLQLDVDRAFDNFWSMVSFPMSRDLFSDVFDDGASDIKADVRDTGAEVEITAELPGVKEDDVEVNVSPQSVTIRAERKDEREERSQDAVLHERKYGLIERTLPLPSGLVTDSAAARIKDGVLTIVVPKSAEAQSTGRKIKIQAS